MTHDRYPDADHWRRAWLLLLINGAARAGLTPIEQTDVHRAAFLANALAPLYDLPVENGLVVRWKRGPFFPDLQWDLDRLATMGLLTFRQVEPVKDSSGKWFCARYELGSLAASFLAATLQLESSRRVYRLHCELFAALAALSDDDNRSAALHDATYANLVDGDLKAEQTVIDFASFRDQNFTARATRAIGESLKDLAVNEREKLHLYVRYLGRRAGQVRRRV
ncbi:MAG: hypothetical protein V4618_15610 [Pseudomonadota bacterium]